ncbi:MAG: hypothetical protein EXQ94_03285 [Alphaproteobacteria bacterium]|nr:hypothetical protein [Alphaproteobacteria bacterium]
MIDGETLRSLVRDAIAGELAGLRKGAKAAPIAIGSDADLRAFARDVLRLAEDAAVRAAIAAGTYPFTLATGAGPATGQGNPVATIDKGVVTETSLTRLPKGIVKLLLADGVTVTPLAKDRARRLGITIERLKP